MLTSQFTGRSYRGASDFARFTKLKIENAPILEKSGLHLLEVNMMCRPLVEAATRVLSPYGL